MVRTDYSGTLGTRMQRMWSKLGQDDGWLNKMRQNQEKIDGATFDPDGAYNTIEGGNTPVGVPAKKATYEPKK